jgi:hypothetical protein
MHLAVHWPARALQSSIPFLFNHLFELNGFFRLEEEKLVSRPNLQFVGFADSR